MEGKMKQTNPTPTHSPTETVSKYDWADWQLSETRPGIEPMKCDICGDIATHLAIAVEKSAFDPDEKILKRRCNKHFGNTQKKWLQRWRKNNL